MLNALRPQYGTFWSMKGIISRDEPRFLTETSKYCCSLKHQAYFLLKGYERFIGSSLGYDGSHEALHDEVLGQTEGCRKEKGVIALPHKAVSNTANKTCSPAAGTLFSQLLPPEVSQISHNPKSKSRGCSRSPN